MTVKLITDNDPEEDAPEWTGSIKMCCICRKWITPVWYGGDWRIPYHKNAPGHVCYGAGSSALVRDAYRDVE